MMVNLDCQCQLILELPSRRHACGILVKVLSEIFKGGAKTIPFSGLRALNE